MKKQKRSNFHLLLNNSRDGVMQEVFSFIPLLELTQLMTVNTQFCTAIDYRLSFEKFTFKQIFQGYSSGVYEDSFGYNIKKWPCEKLLFKLVKYKSFNYNDFDDYTLLFSLWNNYNLVSAFLICKGNPNIHCWNDEVLDMLCKRGNIESLKLILKNERSIFNENLIKTAANNGKFTVVEFLLTKNGVKLTEFVMECFLIKRLDLFKKYLNHPTYTLDNQLLATVIEYGCSKAVMYILDNKIIDINTVNNLNDINITSFIIDAIETRNIKALELVNNELNVCEIDTDISRVFNGLKGNILTLNYFFTK